MRLPTRLCLSALLCSAALPAAAAAQSVDSLLSMVVTAMGGRERILAVRTLALEGAGENYNLGQNRSPEADLPVFAVTEHRRMIDFAGRRWRQEQVREPRFVAGNAAPQRQRAAVDGEVAFDVGNDGVARRSGARAATDRAAELLHHPIGFLQAALAPGAQVTVGPTQDGMRALRLEAGGATYTMLVDAQRRPAKIQRDTDHAMLGDVVLATEFPAWSTVDGLAVPARIVQRLDRWATADITFTRTAVNADVGDLAAPAGVRAAQPPTPAPVNVAVEEVAPGVWYLAGQSHHSVAIEMQDHLLLVEAPLNEARTLAVIARARELRPGKPVRAVITTHHHFDHSGGVRAAMSEGLAILTHSASVAFFEALARRPFTRSPDALARAGRAVQVLALGSPATFGEGTPRPVQVHHIRGSAHAETLVMVYLPAERLLIEADVYSPPAVGATPGPAPFAANLVETIDRLGLQVDRIVPIHGRVVPIADLRAAAAATPTP